MSRSDIEARLARFRALRVRTIQKGQELVQPLGPPKVTVLAAGPDISTTVSYDMDGGPAAFVDFVTNAPTDIEALLAEIDRLTDDMNGLLDDLTRPGTAS